jgi:hypothetical protein
VPDNRVGSCLDPGLPGTGLELRSGQGEGKAEAGPGPFSGGGGRQLESSRDGGNMTKTPRLEKPIRDVMQQGQQPTE